MKPFGELESGESGVSDNKILTTLTWNQSGGVYQNTTNTIEVEQNSTGQWMLNNTDGLLENSVYISDSPQLGPHQVKCWKLRGALNIAEGDCSDIIISEKSTDTPIIPILTNFCNSDNGKQ